MASTTWVSLLNAGQPNQTGTGTALASSTSLTDISSGGLTAGQAFTLPASFLEPGMQLRVRANGIVSTTGAPNLTMGVYLGGVAGVALASTGAVSASANMTNQTWILSADLRVETAGPTGTIRTIGSVIGAYFPSALMPATSSSGNSVTVDTSVPKILTIGAQWGTNSASNSIQLMQFLVESVQF